MNNKLRQRKWIKTIRKSNLFDSNYYLHTYQDVKEADIDPIKHYVLYGWKEGRNPSEYFDTSHYLRENKDVANSKINPFAHYIMYGRGEGRIPTMSKIVGSVRKDGVRSTVKKILAQASSIVDTKIHISQASQDSIQRIVFDDVKEGFVEYKANPQIDTDLKVIAFYLPQFHPFPENDEWWGKGFTEWTNVTKAKQNFTGHYQPHLPIHNGFYDLRVPEVMVEQAKLARNYGIHGFNFYYYWFDGKILMHRPFEILLEHKEIDINFCITWANENWTRRWDGAENDVLIAQNHSDEDSSLFLESLYRFFDDPRYIKVDGKPLLIIYRADIIPDMKGTINLWRNKAKKDGYPGLYLVCSQTFGIRSPEPYGFDAAMEFPPHTAQSGTIADSLDIWNLGFNGKIFDYSQVVNNAVKQPEPDYKLFRTAMLSWDNTARKQDSSHIFYNFTLLKYKQWLENIVTRAFNNKYSEEEKFVFINAWNEWAEGTHLEPDRKYGYGYLDTTFQAIRKFDRKSCMGLAKQNPTKNNNIAVILHIHYHEVWEEIASYLDNLATEGFDLYVTLTNTNNGIIEKITTLYPSAYIKLVENRGRDILPFIQLYSELKELGYDIVCKVHSKQSKYRDDGSQIRDELYQGLLSAKSIKEITSLFVAQLDLGLVTPKKYLIEHTAINMLYNNQKTQELAKKLEMKFEYGDFPAGSMYWFRPKALSGIEKINSELFDVELGLVDGTTAHAVERLVSQIVKSNQYTIVGL